MTGNNPKERTEYDILKQGIQDCPVTYLPALLSVVVEQCHAKGVFRKGGLVRVVKHVLENLENRPE